MVCMDREVRGSSLVRGLCCSVQDKEVTMLAQYSMHKVPHLQGSHVYLHYTLSDPINRKNFTVEDLVLV